ncbi:hypothetical protein BDA96_03G335900 [Sorghum bicolor]|uniref:Uncharacterized protein n=1 Tax=Sorghum bicolor TaxID=4558 RepID=A0A921UPB7_SORBI|nr:hypothetical protein BDA96_03G335900 [Sorghum bicolor]
MADPVEWSRENITFLHENEVNADAENWLAVTVVLKVPPTANQDSVNRELIRCAILDKCRIIVFKSDIMQYDHGYLVRTSGREETQLILNTEFLDVGPNKLIVYPWSPYNGSTCQYFDHIPPNIGMVTPAKRPRESDVLENLKVRGHGLPPHLCTSNVIRKVFSSICRFHKMEIYQGDLSFAIWTFASRQCIPDTWTVAVIKDTMLYMWPLWLFVEGCAPPPAPRSEVLKNTRVKFNLYPGTSLGGGGGGASGSGGGGTAGGHDGHSREAMLLGYVVESPSSSDSSSDSGSSQPDSPCQSDLFAEPTLRVSTSDTVSQVPETPLGSGETELVPAYNY